MPALYVKDNNKRLCATTTMSTSMPWSKKGFETVEYPQWI